MLLELLDPKVQIHWETMWDLPPPMCIFLMFMYESLQIIKCMMSSQRQFPGVPYFDDVRHPKILIISDSNADEDRDCCDVDLISPVEY